MKKKDMKQLFKKPIPSVDHMYALMPVPVEMHSQSIVINSLKGTPNGFMTSDRKAYVIGLNSSEKKGRYERFCSIKRSSNR